MLSLLTCRKKIGIIEVVLKRKEKDALAVFFPQSHKPRKERNPKLMRRTNPTAGLPSGTAKLIKVLTIMAAFTLLMSLLCSVWYSMSEKITATLNLDEVHMIQLEEPQPGDPIAIMHTNLGDMTYILYPQECPKAVENFISLAQSGYYDQTYVFRVEQEIFFSAGSPTTEGTLTEEAIQQPQELVERELTPNLWPLRGALCALTTKTDANFWQLLTKTQKYYNGSRFLVVDTIEMTEEIKTGLLEGNHEENPVANAFIEHGGIPNYSQQLTIFGQLYEGFEVLDAITEAKLQGEENAMRPVEDIVITSVEISEFQPKTE